MTTRFWPAAHFLLFACLWAVPMIYCGVSNKSPTFLPTEMRIYYRLAALFTRRSQEWADPHVEVRQAGYGSWDEIHLPDYDGLQIYGYFI